MKKDFLSIKDLTRDEIFNLFEEANYLRKLLKEGKSFYPLKGKTLGMIFRKPSTRTRLSFEVGMYQLGGHPIFLSLPQLQLKRGETIEDTAKVLSLYIDAIMIRTFDHQEVIRFAKAATIPVINGLTDLLHPCQALSDYYTIWRKKKNLKKIKWVYVGDVNNVCNSLILGASILGVNLFISHPPEYKPNEEIISQARESKEAKITFVKDPLEAVKEADIIYTDVWTSMGKEKEEKDRRSIFKDYQVNLNLVKKAKEDVIIMHCLPAHRGEEITDEVIDGKKSIVFEQAENRLHLQKALLVKLLGSKIS
ncbi:ornithine carbamoyltransferase [Candidatus Aerophobetes bacterium]|nr:ornithine carbamoyltransferase [Candidatus Aerophobetes bacterium]